ncbi:glycerol-3-phosphate 1-O-acyltransferase PlsY [Mycoplasmopsis gallopavonis]|nr:glycerol-3-phosphate 1-O-acyltransferase PlsY [Mycoplasmopsis gallopavonis]
MINFYLIITGYLVGSLNISILLSKIWKKQDVRQFHSENAGATNSYRTFGKLFGITVLLLDILKGYLTVALGYAFWSYFAKDVVYAPMISGLACMIGHTFPIFFKFKGGKGVGCAIGILIALNISLLFVAAIFFFGITILTRYVSLGSVATALILIPFTFIPWISKGDIAYTTPISLPFWVNGLIYIFCAALIVFNHRSNIQRLINGTERKFEVK